jgi:riboflavin synthase
MFTGIIEEVATVRSHDGGELIVVCDLIRSDAALGDSIAVNGVDLTVRTIDDDALRFDIMTETYRRANLDELAPGSVVNLERSVNASTRLSGHIVRGVVETTCTLDSFTPEGEAIIARYLVEPEFLKFIVMKGPVTVDGVSLTVMDRDDESFSVSLVQYTQEHTNLMQHEPGDLINLETDIFARYVDQLLEARAATT